MWSKLAILYVQVSMPKIKLIPIPIPFFMVEAYMDMLLDFSAVGGFLPIKLSIGKQRYSFNKLAICIQKLEMIITELAQAKGQELIDIRIGGEGIHLKIKVL